MKIQNALTIWLFVFSLLPVSIVGCVALHGGERLVVYAVAACVALVLFACVVATKCFFDPIFAFLNTIKRLTPGDFDARLCYPGKSELADVTRSLNGIIDSLHMKNLQLQKRIEQLADREQQYRFALELQSDLFFEADAATGEFSTDEAKWHSYFDSHAPKTYGDLLKIAGRLVHPEEYDSYIDTFSRNNLQKHLDKGNLNISIEARILDRSGEFQWSRHSICLIPDKRSQLAKIIGHIKNIQEQRKKEDEKTVRYQKDGLTGLYTKTVAEKLIQDYLDGDGRNMKHALLVIDIDNFKTINDTCGHPFGDAVLKELSAGMTNLFRYSDIIGRIGGDEFVILLKHITLANLMPEKLEALLEVFNSVASSIDTEVRISGSIGVSTYPQDGSTYQELFKKADHALYVAKKNGKNTYCFYGDEVESQKNRDLVHGMSLKPMAQAGDSLAIERRDGKYHIAERIFQILYESRDFDRSINLIMETIGLYCNVSRVYVFQNLPDGKTAKYTHEWCREGVRPDIDTLGVLDYSLWGDYRQYFNSDGVFYCPDTSTLPKEIYEGMNNEGVYAFLECAIYKNGAFIGFVGFDECTGKRLWKKDEIDTLILVSRILGIALRNAVS